MRQVLREELSRAGRDNINEEFLTATNLVNWAYVWSKVRTVEFKQWESLPIA